MREEDPYNYTDHYDEYSIIVVVRDPNYIMGSSEAVKVTDETPETNNEGGEE